MTLPAGGTHDANGSGATGRDASGAGPAARRGAAAGGDHDPALSGARFAETRRGEAPDHGIRPHGTAVLAVSLVFSSAGFSMASAISRMPEIKARVGATATELAFALVCVGVGSIVSMPFAGRLTARFGTAAITRLFAGIALVGWALIPLAHSVPQLAAILFITGTGVGTWDVAMNVQGSMVERTRRQVLMPLWHGLFSVGAVAGALLGAAAARWQVPLPWQLPAVSVLLAVVVMVSCRAFIPSVTTSPTTATSPREAGPIEPPAAPKTTADGTAPAPRRRRLPSWHVILLGLIMLSTAIGEGAANDWLAVALVDERAAPAAFGALALAGFNLTMAIGRFTGGPLIARIGRVAALRAAGSIAAAGVLLLCLVPSTTTALIGALAWGLGLAIVFPSAVSAAGEIPGHADQAIATVSTIGYGGFLLGAPLIGSLAHVIPLMDALLVVAAFAVLIVLLAPFARERRGSGHTLASSPDS